MTLYQVIYERLLDEVGQVFPGHFRAPGPIGGFTLGICKEEGTAPGRPVRLGFQVVNERVGVIDTEHYLNLLSPDWKLLRAALREAREHVLEHLASSLQFCGVPLTNKPVLDPPPSRLTFDQLDWQGAAVLCGLPSKALEEMTERFKGHLGKKGTVLLYGARGGGLPARDLKGQAKVIKDDTGLSNKMMGQVGSIMGVYPTDPLPGIFDQDRAARLAQEMNLPILVVQGAQRFPDLTLPNKTKVSASAIYWAESREGLLTVVKHRNGSMAGNTFRVVA